ncbi:hypothetical protein C9I57_07305 [Trinickia symbiotica]|uniref:Uncharacterized protein n=2 Tax=Trinickia symbiotica TaxID=863227 RepID=A0A2T3XY66_9BURK|nr:hypothetical protein C9I57_07305 [Trinickia symbiotica]
MKMSNSYLNKAVATAIALLSLNNVAFAQDSDACTVASLRGTFGTKIHAELLGVLTGTAPNQTLHRFAVPGVIDGIALQTFDGNGTGAQKDFVMLNGTRLPGAPADFESDETLSYTVNSDCTGELVVNIGNGKRTITTKLIVLDHGNQLYSVTSAQHVSTGPSAADGTSCAAGCDLAIQTSTVSVRVGGERGR